MSRRSAVSICIFAASILVLVLVLVLSLARSGARSAGGPAPAPSPRPPAGPARPRVDAARPTAARRTVLTRSDIDARPSAARRTLLTRPEIAARPAPPGAFAIGRAATIPGDGRRLRAWPSLGNPFGDRSRLTPPPTRHPAYVGGPLDGERTAWDVARRRPLAVIVENYDPDARPQTGLNAASLVFETVAEGGITRFMAVYLEHEPPVVGPVRSARVYFNAWANGLHAVLVHAGGNDDALAQLWHLPNVADLNEVAFEDAKFIAHVPFFSRSPDRQMPHNLYTYPALVRRYLAGRHVSLQGAYPDALPHRGPDAPGHRPTGGVLDLNFSSPGYAVEYRYDHAGNRYRRWMGGGPHLDAATGHQIAPSNVVVLLASIGPDPFGGVGNPGAVYVQSTGKNLAYLFRDGYRYAGTWHKPHGGSHLELLDSRGRPFAFNPGQTWIEVLPASGSMVWTPGTPAPRSMTYQGVRSAA